MNDEITINLLLEWGKANLLSPLIKSYLKHIEEEFEDIVGEIDIDKVLLGGMKLIDNQVDSSINILSSPDLITATDEDDIWYEAQDAFLKFDSINYLFEAVNYIIQPKNENLAVQVNAALDEIMKKIIAWIEDSDFSPLRLTVLNSFRNKYLEAIPENKRYLFPWYELFADLDEEVLESITEYFDVIFDKKALSSVVLNELKRDKELFSILSREHTLGEKIKEAASKRTALTLWRLGDVSAVDYSLAQEIENAGLIRTSVSLLTKKLKSLRGIEEKLELEFLSAFCGPGLNDVQRIQVLKKVLSEVAHVTFDTEDNKAPILYGLNQWLGEGLLGDKWIVNASFNGWLSLLKEEAKLLKAGNEDISPSEFWRTLQQLMDKDINTAWKLSWNKVEAFLENIFSPQILAPVRSPMSTSTTAQEPLSLKLAQHIKITLEANQEQQYNILPKPNSKEIKFCNSMEEYEKLYAFIEKTKTYCAGVAKKDGDEIDRLEVKQINRSYNIYAIDKQKKYRSVIIGISSDEEILKQGVEALLTEGKEKVLQSKIVWVICALE